MKAKIVTLLFLFPLAVAAQNNPGNKSVEQFFNYYSNYPNYSFLEVNEDMFKLFKNVESADYELINKLKLVRMLQYEGATFSVSTRTREGITTSRVRTSGRDGDGEEFEVTTSVGNIKPINISANSILYNQALEELNLQGFTTLMKSNQGDEKMILLRKEHSAAGSDPADQEFLLISGNTLIQVRGKIDITTLYHMEEIVDAMEGILDV